MKSMAEQMAGLFNEEKKAYKPLQKEVKANSNSKSVVTDDLSQLNDEQLKTKLLQSWGYSTESLIVWGKLEKVSFGDVSFIKLAHVRSIHDNALLEYLIDTENNITRKGVYIEREYSTLIYETLGYRFVKCELEFSPIKEREKHENPFLLKVKTDSVEPLSQIPSLPSGDLVQNDDTAFISQAVFDLCVAARKVEIDAKEAEMHANLEEEKRESTSELNLLTTEITDVQHKVVTSINQYDALTEKNKNLTSNIQNLSQSEQQLVSDIESLKLTYKEV